jgi:catechol 2,3-dioxygenase-like lactoylglutathione lyase family enzyme
MSATAVTPSPGFISIAVADAQRSVAFYETYLGAVRDTFDFGPDAVAFVGWPTFGAELGAPTGRSGTVARNDEHPAVVASQRLAGAVREGPRGRCADRGGALRGPFGRTFTMADPDGSRITIYEKDQPLFWPPKSH